MKIISKTFEDKTLFERIDLIQKTKRAVVKKPVIPIDISVENSGRV